MARSGANKALQLDGSLAEAHSSMGDVLHNYDWNGRRPNASSRKPAGRSELESLVLAPWASRRRQDLLDVIDQLTPKI